MKITIQCYGTYRNFADEINLELDAGARVSDVRGPLMAALQKIDESFADLALLERSKFATETDVLQETDPVTENTVLAVIPPVSGG